KSVCFNVFRKADGYGKSGLYHVCDRKASSKGLGMSILRPEYVCADQSGLGE
ncbi:hypothetical protein BKA70DRAFT_1126585, partial [Coprinopsis sp. MPI-PUGE-AT-0042]